MTRPTDPTLLNLDMTDIRILRGLGEGKMSFRELGEATGVGYKPQFLAHRVKGLVGRGWVVVGKMDGKGNGSKRTRTLTRGGRMALKRFGGVVVGLGGTEGGGK